MRTLKMWEIWFANFPFDDSDVKKKRPVIVLNIEPAEVLSIKVTSHNARNDDKYDVAIEKWEEAGLDRPSVARISKSMILIKDEFIHKIGTLHTNDQTNIMMKYIQFINDNT